MTAVLEGGSTYLLPASKEAPAHISNQPAVSLFTALLPMVVAVRQIIVPARHDSKVELDLSGRFRSGSPSGGVESRVWW
jgi:hypothetical protein